MDRLTELRILQNLSGAACKLAGGTPAKHSVPEKLQKPDRPPRYEWIAMGPGPNDGYWDEY